MLLRLAKMITHLGTHILPPMLQLSLTVNVYGKLRLLLLIPLLPRI